MQMKTLARCGKSHLSFRKYSWWN